jgi:hypothetical protein
MRGLRRAIVGLFGLAVSVAAGLVALPIAAALDPVTRRAGATFAQFALQSVAQSSLDGGAAAYAAAGLVLFVWTAVVGVCVVPLVIAVLIGEIGRLYSWLWYAGATGVAAASAPWLARALFQTQKAASASPQELRFAFVFFLTGVVSGSVFWLIAGGCRNELSPPN